MTLLKSLQESASTLAALPGQAVFALGQGRLRDLVEKEIRRARVRVVELERQFPNASPRDLAQKLIEEKKAMAGLVGGVTGVFGLLAIPADWAAMAYLQLSLLVDIATAFKVSLKSERAQKELVDLWGYTGGVGPFRRATPQVFARLSSGLLRRAGMATFGRVVPLVASPMTAYLNNKHIQAIGDSAIAYFGGFDSAEKKRKAQSGMEPGTP